MGIQNRASHLHIPEPEVAQLFRSSSSTSKKAKKSSASSSSSDIDIDAIEKRLKRAKREKPKSVEQLHLTTILRKIVEHLRYRYEVERIFSSQIYVLIF